MGKRAGKAVGNGATARDTPSAHQGDPTPRRRLSIWVARLAVVILAPALFLTVAELGLRVFGYGYDPSYFLKSDDGKRYLASAEFTRPFFGRELARTPIPTILTERKPKDVYRVFVLGGSAARGEPNPSFSFSRLLEAMLNQRYPGTRFEVVNTGLTAINSHVVLSVIKECRGFDGDLFIVYTGNNEVIGPYGPGTVFDEFRTSRGLIRARIFVRSMRLGQLMDSLARFVADTPEVTGEKWRGLEMFLAHRLAENDPRMTTVYDHYRGNLRDTCAVACRASVPIIVSTVLANISDFAPFSSEHRPGLSDKERSSWERHYKDGAARQVASENEQAIASYQQAARIDDRFAELHFRLGNCHLALGQFDSARRHLQRALDLDQLRMRADSRINQIVREVASGRENEGIHLVDAERIVAAAGYGPPGILGGEVLHEHVHMNFTGNHAVAAALFEKISQLLPKAMPKGLPDDVTAPSLEEAARLTCYTEFNRYECALMIAKITSRPPFSQEQHELQEALVNRLKMPLHPAALQEIAETHQRHLEQNPEDLFVRTNFGDLQFFRGKYSSASEQWRLLLSRYPNETDWRVKLGRNLVRERKPAEAVEQYRLVLNLHPDVAKVHSLIAVALFAQGKVEEAIAECEKALSIQPDDATVQRGLGQILLSANRLAEAKSHLAIAAKEEPDAAPTQLFLGHVLLRQNKPAQAMEAYRRAVALDPTLASAHTALGHILDKQGKTDEAIVEYRKASAADRHNGLASFRLGMALHRKGLSEEAIVSLKQALQVRSDYASTYYLLANAYYDLARVEAARKFYRHAVQLDARFAGDPYKLGALLSQENAADQALSSLTKLAEDHPDVAPVQGRLGRALLDRGRAQQALARFQRALALAPEWETVLNNLAWLYATHPEEHLRDGDQAVRLAEQACAANADSANCLDALAAAYAETGQFEKAVGTARKAHELAKRSGDAELAGKILSRIELYRSEKPYRESSP